MAPCVLPDGLVQLWLLPRDEDRLRHQCATGLRLLSDDERARVEASANAVVARRFLLGRVLMRRALAAHLGADPASLVIAVDPLGRPRLLEPAAPGLAFNLSHSGRDRVLALAQCERLGVDLEPIDRAAPMRRIAEAFYSVPERRQIARQGDHATARALQLWTVKEAVVKAMGWSVWAGLRGVRCAIDAGRMEWLVPPPEGGEAAWSLALGRLRRDHWLAFALKWPVGPAPNLSVDCRVVDGTGPEEGDGATPFALQFSSRAVRPRSSAG